MKIAVLLTCHNRKSKTLESLKSLYEIEREKIDFDVYLTDDNSSDGTKEAVLKEFEGRNIVIVEGDGSLYWAGGMRAAWNEAMKKGRYDGYLLINDDTVLLNNLFGELLLTDKYAKENFGKSGIYIGSTKDKQTNKITYGGAVFDNRFLAKSHKLLPSGLPQECELGNANIMYVSKSVVEKIGILHSGFTHGAADFDYTLSAVKHKIPVLITPGYCGICENDHPNKSEKFRKKNIKERRRFLYAPTGLAFRDQMHYMKRNFPYRVPFVYIAAWMKVLFLPLYTLLNKIR